MSSSIAHDTPVSSQLSNEIPSTTTMARPCNGDEPRRQYITRLLSSSLLAQSLHAEPTIEAPHCGSVDLITLRVNSKNENEVVQLLSDQISSLGENISWFVAKSTEEEATWMILETQLSAPRLPSSPPRKVTDHQTLSIENKPVQIIRQSSRFIEAFRSSVPGGANPLGDFLSAASSLTSCPPEMSRSRMIVAPLASHKKMSPTLDRKNNDLHSYLTIILETVKTKIGQAKAFIESCTALESSLSTTAELETGLITVEVHQDLEPSAGGRLFDIVYYFLNEESAKAFRQTDLWKRWRRSVALLLEGPPRLQFYQSVFDSRSELRAYTIGERETSRTTTELDVHVQLSPMTPKSMVTQVTETISKRQTSPSGEIITHSIKPTAMDGTAVVERDKRLEPFTDYLRERFCKYLLKKAAVLCLPLGGKSSFNSFDIFSTVHEHFGLHRTTNRNAWVLREWLPNVKEVYLMGEFNEWNRNSCPLSKEPTALYGDDVWSVTLDDTKDNLPILKHKAKYKLHIITQDGQELDRLPPSACVVWKSLDQQEVFDAAVWNPSELERHIFKHPSPIRPNSLKIYEAYVGFSSSRYGQQFGTYNDFRTDVLPRVHRLGYNTLLLLGIPQHSLTSVGWHVTNMLAPTSEFGTPEELKKLIDAAHESGIFVMLSLVQSHASSSTIAGLNELDGTDEGYFRKGMAGRHPQWDTKLFDYAKPQVCRFLLSQISYFMNEYHIDGFRFEGLTSMLYHHHGIGRDFKDVNEFGKYFSFESDDESATYLMLANDFVHSIATRTQTITIGTDHSRMPVLAHNVLEGGLGFDYRMAPHIADEWVRQLCHATDLKMDIISLVHSLELRLPLEKAIASSETWSNSLRSRRPLHIAMFAWESLHTHAVGGVAPHVTELSAGLARLGHEVHVFVRAIGAVAQHSVHYGVHYHECPFHLNADFIIEMQNMCSSFIGHLNATEQFMCRQFDICHVHDWLAAKTIVQTKQQGHTCIQTMHSTEFGRCGNNFYGGNSKRISDIEREACHISDRVICVSGVLADEVSHLFGVHRQKIKVIYNGINACNFDGFEDAAPIKACYGIQTMEPMLLFVGRMTVQKGPDLLIEAIPFILKFRADVKFVLVGDGHMKAGLISRAQALGIEHACRFLGTKSGNELKSLFKASDAVVVPSRNEPFGIVVLEAWSAFKPVVATTCGGPRDFVSPNNDGVLVDPNASSIAWGCCEILKNFEHSRWMGERGRVKAAYSFSWDHIAKQTETVYYEQLNLHDSPDSEGGLGGCSLAFRLMGPSMYEHMGVFDQNDHVNRGLALHKMIRLITFGLGGEGYLNFMGNEFGHPEFIDVPRGGNNFSFFHTNRRFSLANDKLLKYKHLEFFDACLIRLENHCQWLSSSYQFVSAKHEHDKVVAFEKGPCLFVFNFHPHQSYEGYQIGHSLGFNLHLLLDTDDVRFGGYNRLSSGYDVPYPTLESFNNRKHSIKLYLPSRTAMILAPSGTNIEGLSGDSIFSIKNVDEFINKLTKQE